MRGCVAIWLLIATFSAAAQALDVQRVFDKGAAAFEGGQLAFAR
jgi:hypothetical protein